MLPSHNISVEMQTQILDKNGRVKKSNMSSMDFMQPWVWVGDKLFPGRSFVASFLEAMLDVMTNGGANAYNITAAADVDNGIMLGWDTGTDTEIRYVSPADTYAAMSALLKLPSTNDGYDAQSLTAGLVPITLDGNLPASKIQMSRLFQNSSTQKYIREVFLTAKKSSSHFLFSRDNYAPLTNDAARLSPRAEIVNSVDALSVGFDFIMLQKKDTITVHDNFVKYIYNALFEGLGAGKLGMVPITGGAAVHPAAAAYAMKSAPDTVSNGMDILLHTPTGIPSDFDFSTNGTDTDLSFVLETNSEFATKTLSLNGGSASPSISNKEAKFTISKLFSGHNTSFPFAGASLMMEDTASSKKFRMVTHKKASTGDLSVAPYDLISTDDMLKVIFTFVVNCGDYSYSVSNVNKNVAL